MEDHIKGLAEVQVDEVSSSSRVHWCHHSTKEEHFCCHSIRPNLPLGKPYQPFSPAFAAGEGVAMAVPDVKSAQQPALDQ